MSILSRRFLNICTNIRQFSPYQPCLLCGAASLHGVCCPGCVAALPRLSGELCPVCALPTAKGAVCGQCLRHPPRFARTVAAYAYAFPLDKLVLALKYGEKLHLANMLADSMAHRIAVRPDCIVPMPLHPARLRERGFNQSLQLARRIGRRLDIPVLPFACRRIRNTPSQSSLPWKERGRNMHAAFSCEGKLAGKHVAVVDDVMTTGTTLNELALTLLKAGATEISAWVAARTLPHK